MTKVNSTKVLSLYRMMIRQAAAVSVCRDKPKLLVVADDIYTGQES